MNKSILIIDDDEEDHFILREAFEEAGVNAILYSADSGETGLRLLEELKDLPSLVLLDLNMPKVCGMQTLKKIKEKYSVPVLIHSSACDDQLREQVKSVGALDCIKKGYTHDDIIKTAKFVEQILETR